MAFQPHKFCRDDNDSNYDLESWSCSDDDGDDEFSDSDDLAPRPTLAV